MMILSRHVIAVMSISERNADFIGAQSGARGKDGKSSSRKKGEK